MDKDPIKIVCPICDWRLFDADESFKGKVKIKCTRCSSVVVVDQSCQKKKEKHVLLH